MTDQQPTVEVITTVRIGAETKTFTATGDTTGDAGKAARGLIIALSGDAQNWTHDAGKVTR